MRGFVITMISMSLILILMALSMSLRSSHDATERVLIEPLPLLYAAFLLDDTAYEFNSIIGPEIAFNETNESLSISVKDTIHANNHSSDVMAYSAFLGSEVAGRTESNISTNFTNMTGGTVRLFLNEDYEYSNDHGMSEISFTKDGGTGAASYEISFAVYSLRQNVTHMAFNESGTMNVTIHYTDLNGTDTEEGSVFPNDFNVFEVQYPNGTRFVVSTGMVGGNPASMRLKTYGTWAEVSWTARLPPLNETVRRGYEYDATIEYSQGPVKISRRIGK